MKSRECVSLPCRLNDFTPFCLAGIESTNIIDGVRDFAAQCHVGSKEIVMGDKEGGKSDRSIG